MSETVFRLPDMTAQEANDMCAGVYRTFMSPKYVLRQLTRIRSLQDLDYVRRGVIAVLGHLNDFVKQRRTTSGSG
jgi:hypothetical protein